MDTNNDWYGEHLEFNKLYYSEHLRQGCLSHGGILKLYIYVYPFFKNVGHP